MNQRKKKKKHKKKVFIKRSKQKQNISKERIEEAKQANKQKSRTSVQNSFSFRRARKSQQAERTRVVTRGNTWTETSRPAKVGLSFSTKNLVKMHFFENQRAANSRALVFVNSIQKNKTFRKTHQLYRVCKQRIFDVSPPPANFTRVVVTSEFGPDPRTDQRPQKETKTNSKYSEIRIQDKFLPTNNKS